MAKSLRIEGVAGGSSGLSGKTKGLTRAEIKKIQKAKPLANPKSAVKVVAKDPVRQEKFNRGSTVRNLESIMGIAAKKGAAKLGVTGTKGVQPPVKIGGGKLGALKKQIENAKPLSKAESKANARGLKAANKPTKASKTFIGSNKNLSTSVRRDIIVNQTKPARPNRERGGSLKTLRRQGKTGTSK